MNQEEFFEAMGEVFLDEWRGYANCIGTDKDIWIEPEREAEAENICSGCSVWIECVEDALRWGDGGFRGLSEETRVKVSRHRRRYNKLFEYDMKQAGVVLEGKV